MAHAAANISNAISQQNTEDQTPPGMATSATDAGATSSAAATGEYAEVDQFLNSIGLSKYKDRFVENGIEDEETVLELHDEHLDALSVPLGHKLKILKRIKMLR